MADAAPAPDLDAYCARIGYTGSRAPTLATLQALHLHHVAAIPFENLDVLLGRGIALEPEALERKLVHARRGGYCFEQNALFAAVLRALGFRVATLIARVRWQVPPERGTPRSHMILRVDLDDASWIADVGFGSIGLTVPIAFDPTGTEQTTPHEPRRLVAVNGCIAHQVRLGSAWHDVFHFTPDEVPAVDYEVANWFTSRHPHSHFLQNLIVTRARTDGGRDILFNRELTRRSSDGAVEKRAIGDPDELLAVLATTFGLHFPAGSRFGAGGAAWPS